MNFISRRLIDKQGSEFMKIIFSKYLTSIQNQKITMRFDVEFPALKRDMRPVTKFVLMFLKTYYYMTHYNSRALVNIVLSTELP